MGEDTVVYQQTESQACWRGYYGACGVPKLTAASMLPKLDRYVKSYRGKPKYIENNSGEGKIKVFNDFTSYLYTHYLPPMIYCGSKVAYIEGHPFDWMLLGSSATTGSFPKFFGQAACLTELRNRREFLERDLYGKALAPRFNSAASIAELGETLTGVKDLLQGAVKMFFKGGFKGLIDIPKTAAHFAGNTHEVWLWYRYALMPTILEINDLLTALDKNWRAPDRVRVGDTSDYTLKGTFGTGKWFGSTIFEFNYETKVEFRGGGAMDIYAPKMHQDWGTSAMDVIAAGWEIVPFSFLIDWFIGLGDWLATLRQAQVKINQMYATGVVNIQTTISPKTTGLSFPEGEPRFTCFHMERITDFEAPQFPLFDPQWANATRAVDIIALTIGILKGILSKGRR